MRNDNSGSGGGGAMKDFKVSKKLFISYAAIMILFVVSCFVSITDSVSYTHLGLPRGNGPR